MTYEAQTGHTPYLQHVSGIIRASCKNNSTQKNTNSQNTAVQRMLIYCLDSLRILARLRGKIGTRLEILEREFPLPTNNMAYQATFQSTLTNFSCTSQYQGFQIIRTNGQMQNGYSAGYENKRALSEFHKVHVYCICALFPVPLFSVMLKVSVT